MGNIMTGEKTWTRPVGFDNISSRRGAFALPMPVMPVIGHCNAYVGSLPAGMNDMVFRQLFEGFGHIVAIKMVPEAYYGFVRYSDTAEAQKAIDMMNGFVCNGVQLAVRFANKDR